MKGTTFQHGPRLSGIQKPSIQKLCQTAVIWSTDMRPFISLTQATIFYVTDTPWTLNTEQYVKSKIRSWANSLDGTPLSFCFAVFHFFSCEFAFNYTFVGLPAHSRGNLIVALCLPWCLFHNGLQFSRLISAPCVWELKIKTTLVPSPA